MQTVAQAWLIYRMTGSGELLGLLGFVGQFPIFLLSPLAGLVADRWPRQRVVIATQTASMLLAFILAALTMTGRITVWEIIVLATMLGIVNAFDVPARQSFLIEMVGREDLLNAIALNSSMFNGARVAGPAIAGILVAIVGEGWCFLLNGMSYLAVIAGLFLMRIEKSKPVHDGAAPLEKLREGFRFARHTKPIRALLGARGHRELHGAALHRADADFRRQDSARRGFGLRHIDGRGGSGSDVRRAGAGDARGNCAVWERSWRIRRRGWEFRWSCSAGRTGIGSRSRFWSFPDSR